MLNTATHALFGGALIGLSASLLLVLSGRVAGISGIVGGLMEGRRGDYGWRAVFLLGLVTGAGLLAWHLPGSVAARLAPTPTVGVALAGLAVGFGSQLGGGCTSGHGVCGLSRLSSRSAAAVVSFMLAAALTTFVARHVVPGLQ
jgi:uncharacterized membrane protein YedE/YeeE